MQLRRLGLGVALACGIIMKSAINRIHDTIVVGMWADEPNRTNEIRVTDFVEPCEVISGLEREHAC